MFCPQCGAEYQEGLRECPDCEVPLVGERPTKQAPGPIKFVTVLESNDRTVIAVGESLLQDAGIHYFARGEAWGGGTVQLQVERSHEKEARELLARLGKGHSSSI
jgi:hypothetical protein